MLDVATRCQQTEAFASDVVLGLSQQPKTLPSRWLYDDRGSELFEQITGLEEYYPTRAETAILREHAEAIAAFCGTNVSLLEYGAGAAIKTEILVDALRSPRFYVPIDIAGDFLEQTVTRFQRRFPALTTRAIVADFTSPFALPNWLPSHGRVAFFPGSTIGNLDRTEASSFLKRMRRHVGADGKAIIGVDVMKDVDVLLRAYDDRRGVTAEFDLNILARINRELDGNFVLDRFRHRAVWNDAEAAVEMHLVSMLPQTVTAAHRTFKFSVGETIHTESSRKYDFEGFAALARANDWRVQHVWNDENDNFSIFGLS